MSASATLAGLTLGIGLMILGLQLVSDNWQ